MALLHLFRRRLSARSSLTIIELVIVLGVLFILASSGFSAFQGAITRAHNTTARGNLSVATQQMINSWGASAQFPTDIGLKNDLEAGIPGAIVSVDPNVPLGPRTFYIERLDDQTITACNRSSAGRTYCLRVNQLGELGFPGRVYAFANADSTPDAICNLPGLGVNPAGGCGSGTPGWGSNAS